MLATRLITATRWDETGAAVGKTGGVMRAVMRPGLLTTYSTAIMHMHAHNIIVGNCIKLSALASDAPSGTSLVWTFDNEQPLIYQLDNSSDTVLSADHAFLRLFIDTPDVRQWPELAQIFVV